MGGQGIGFGFQRAKVRRVLCGEQSGSTQVAFRCGFEQVLKDQGGLRLVEEPDAHLLDGECGGGMFGHHGERLLRMPAMNGQILGQSVQHRLLRGELPRAQLFDFLSLLLVCSVMWRMYKWINVL